MGTHVAAFLAEGLKREEAVVVVATRGTHDTIRRHLPAHTDHPHEAPTHTALDADELLSTFLVEGIPDRDRFFTVMDQILGALARSGRPIRVYGEMVVRLRQAGHPEAALQLEELWNLLAERYHFSLLCAYPMRTFETQDSRWFLDTCATHSQLSIVSVKGFS